MNRTLLVCALAFAAGGAQAVTPAEQLAGYRAAAQTSPDPSRGQKLFTTPGTKEWSCSSCHGAVPTGTGKHASTGKAIRPLAPAANAERFTDTAKTEKWFRRNCNDVLSRECTAVEKADVLAYLNALKP